MKLKNLIAVSSAIILAVTGKAQVLLNIDLSTPSAATIAATTGLAASSAEDSANLGIYLMEFFTSTAANIYFPQGVGGNLAPAPLPAQVVGDTILSIQTPDRALNYFAYNNFSANWNFISGAQAFTGITSAMNMSSVTSFLPGLNAQGDIRVGSETGAIIGQWQVTAVAATPVPEPASVALIAGFTMGGFVLVRRRRARA